MEIIGELLAVTNAILYSLTNIFNKKAMEHMDKDSGMVITLLVNFAFYGLGLVALFLAGRWVPWQSGGVLWFVLAGVLTSFLGRYLLLESTNVNGPSRAGAYKVASPMFTMFIGMFIMGERVNYGSLAGALITLAGLYIISSRDLFLKSDGEKAPGSRWLSLNKGVLIGLASGLSFAVGMVARKAGLLIWPSAMAGAFLGAATALILTLVSFQLKGAAIPWRRLASRESANYIYSGLCTSVAILCFFIALELVPVTIANVIASVEPLFTMGLAYFILRKKERITKSLIFGSSLVTLGAALIFIY